MNVQRQAVEEWQNKSRICPILMFDRAQPLHPVRPRPPLLRFCRVVFASYEYPIRFMGQLRQVVEMAGRSGGESPGEDPPLGRADFLLLSILWAALGEIGCV